MKKYIKVFFITFSVGFFSCGPDHALKEETYYFSEDNKRWIPSDSIGENFIIVDNNGISQSVVMERDNYEFGQSWGGVFGINTLTTNTEYLYKSYTSTYGYRYSISLTAGFPPFGDEINVSLNGIGFRYDLDLNVILSIDTQWGYRSMVYTDNGYEVDGEITQSIVTLLDTYSTRFDDYTDVLRFELNDFSEQWNDNTIVSLYLAKTIGLIGFKLNNGITYERKP